MSLWTNVNAETNSVATIYKLLLFFVIFALIGIAGYASFVHLNKKIKESETGWSILGYSLLLIVINAILFAAGLFVLVKSYAFLVAAD